jgi:hypothetical protein
MKSLGLGMALAVLLDATAPAPDIVGVHGLDQGDVAGGVGVIKPPIGVLLDHALCGLGSLGLLGRQFDRSC